MLRCRLSVARVCGLLLFLQMSCCHGFVETEELISDLDKPVPIGKVQGVLGKKASLPCDIQPLAAEDQVSMVLWFKESDGEPFYSYDVRGRLASQPKLWFSTSGFGSRAFFRASSTPATLFVDGVQSSDSGIYRCRVDFKNSPTRNMKINFTVLIPPEKPEIINTKTRERMKLLEPCDEGDNLDFICEVTGGDPSPRVIWLLENTVIDDSFERRPDGVTVNSLSFPNVGRQHLNLRLICQASNTNLAPPLNKVLILNVNLRPLTVQILNKSLQLSADHSYDVDCETTGSRPNAVITWWKGTKQIKRGIKNFSDSNSSISQITFIPEAEDHEKFLICRAHNPRIEGSEIEDKWLLNVHYVPVVSLKMGPNLNPNDIKEGDDVYFECTVMANPRSYKLSWFIDNKEVIQNASAGILASEQSLVLQRVARNMAADYSCRATNEEGTGISNPVALVVRYAPVCKSNKSEVYGALKHETISILCAVDSNPSPSSFTWTFTSSGEQKEVLPSAYINSGFTSELKYTPSRDIDFGTISCEAHNLVGQQETPCVYRLVAANPPMPVQNCSLLRNSSEIKVSCIEGFDGAMKQIFYMEIIELPYLTLIHNVSSNDTPVFKITDLDPRSSFRIKVYAANAKGSSDPVILHIKSTRPPDKYTGPSTTLTLSPMLASLLCLAALLSTAVCAVITALYRRHNRRRNDDTKQVPVTKLFMEPNLEGLAINETLPSYVQTPKLVYSDMECVMKVDPEVLAADIEEVEPDVIPGNYDKLNQPPSIDFIKLNKKDEQTNVYCRNTSIHNSYSRNTLQPLSMSSRGVTARNSDILSASRFKPEVVTTSRRVKESCI